MARLVYIVVLSLPVTIQPLPRQRRREDLYPWLVDPDGYRIELVQWPPGHRDGITAADFG
jgi:hypothetical protein